MLQPSIPRRPLLALALLAAGLLTAPLLRAQEAASAPAPAQAASPAAANPAAAKKKHSATARKAPKAKAAKPTRHAKGGTAPGSADARAPALGQTAAVLAFAAEHAASLNQTPEQIAALLAQARILPSVQRLIMPTPAGTAKDWMAYRDRFVEPRRLQAGLAFWEANAEALARAEESYGVPAEIVLGIIGVETFYGRIMGGFRILDALATLSFDFPTGRSDRSPFFREELHQFLLLSQRDGLDPLALKGSYAGAMGLGQFMPGSWMRHAVDFDGDGHADLINSPADAIGSVANFLAQHGWQRALPTDYTVAAPAGTAERAQLLAPDVRPTFTPAQMQALGARLSEGGQEHTGKLALIELQMGDAAPVYVAGTDNFFALTRYNQSAYYAMAVISLGRKLGQMRRAGIE
ncbi:lytic murein transglycosylase B [Mitsuaria sp. WAJ17]|uniref:lytic murein transglycosylase B n=1 Tax=Mitsuaria sp. WAJ17 TaxID=2761452 RepID=UPI002102ADA1|nr:lytic murein transglycosylase B [Mitsuaria sp. WAJ17]